MVRLGRVVPALMLLVSLLAACGDDSPPAPSAPTDTDSPTETPRLTEVDTFIDGLMRMYDIPGAGVALVQNGAVRYVQGYGVRDTSTGEPVTPDTLFAIGSVTKSFTALGAAQLVDRGVIALDTPVVSYIPSFALSDPGATQAVTVRHLLAQTTGLPGSGDAAWVSGQVSDLQQAITYAAGLPLAAAPGSQHIYSNYNYAIAGYLIEQVSGQSWEDYTRDHIFQPLAMTRANFDIQSIQQSVNFAAPHELDVRDGMQPRSFVSLSGIRSAGAINASAREMANYLLLQLSDGTFNGQQVISTALLNELHALQAPYGPMPPVGPTGFQTKGYALGWFVADFNGYTVLWHNGSIDGFYAMVMFIPSEQVGVVVLSNAGLGTASLFTLAASLGLLEQMMGITPGRDAVAALNEEAAFDPVDRQMKLDAARSYQPNPAEWEPLLGTYSGASGGVSIEASEGRLYLNRGAGRVELVPFEPGGFVAANRTRDGLINTYTIVSGADGVPTLYQDGVLIGQKVS